MTIYFIFIILATIVAIFSEKIDEKINANGKLKRAVIIFCILAVILTSILIKKALQEVRLNEEEIRYRNRDFMYCSYWWIFHI